MLTNDNKALIALHGNEEICILPQMINRHGLITGATGTGKTVTLQTMAETFSGMGVPVVLADVKGDLSGLAAPGKADSRPGQRAEQMGLAARGFNWQPFPVAFWDVFGKNGIPFRATISDVGPLLLARLLDLNDIQAGILQISFKVADDNGLLLLDLKDLRGMLEHVSEEREQYRSQYGQISPASVGAIQRALLRLEEQGGEFFFGEPALDPRDLLHVENGKGAINILDSTTLINSPQLYACALLWLLSEFFEQMPEVGDLPKPRLAIFFDEAHLLFDGISPVLLQKIEQVARLIRSRGVGIYFVSQNPSDIPDSILGQLGNRVQHALRAFTPKDQKAVRAAAQAFRANPAFSTEQAIGELGVGEALISFMDDNGAPNVVQRCLIVPPQSQVGPIGEAMRRQVISASPLYAKYGASLDRESAYEVLTARAAWMRNAEDARERAAADAKARKTAEMEARKQEREQKRLAREQAKNDPLGNILGSIARQTTRTVSSQVARQIGKSVFGTGAGGKIGTSIVRGILGGIFGGSR